MKTPDPLNLPLSIYSPSGSPEHVRLIDGKDFTLFDSQNPDVWPMSPEVRAFIVRACNENAKLHALVDANVIARCDAQDRAHKLAEHNAALESALEAARSRLDFIASALAQGHTVS